MILKFANYRSDVLKGGLSLVRMIEIYKDPVVVLACLFGAAWLCGDTIDGTYVTLGLIAFSMTFPGDIGLHERPRRVARMVVINWLIVAAILFAFGHVTGYTRLYPHSVLLTWLVSTPVVKILAHEALRKTLPRYMAVEAKQKTAVVAGVNAIGVKLARQFLDNPYHGTRFMAFFDDRSRDRLDASLRDLPLLGNLEQLAGFVNANRIDHLYLALPMASQPRILALLDKLKDTTASIYFVPDIFVTDLIQGRMSEIGGMPVVAVCETPFTGFNGAIKRLSDIVLSLLILALVSPIMLAVAIRVKRSSPGPILFKQRRYGQDGREIVIYKFRSMHVCEDGAVVRQAEKNDPRTTSFGAFIRRTSLDELPQFINVLQGRMSIVGPRPHAVAHNELYRKAVKGYMVRHKVRPGITGWAQISGLRGETDTIAQMQKRIECDLEYLRRWSLGLDIWIIVKTAFTIFRRQQRAY